MIEIKTDILPDHQSAQRGNDWSAPAPSFAGMLQCRAPSRSARSRHSWLDLLLCFARPARLTPFAGASTAGPPH